MSSGKNQGFKVVYNSDLIIRDRAEAATLCVFYDQVFLPYTSKETRHFVLGVDESSRIVESSDYRADIVDWELEYGTLFDEGVLRRLPSPPVPDRPVDRVEYTAEEIVTVFEKPRRDDIPEKIFLHEEKRVPIHYINDGTNGPGELLTWDDFRDGDQVFDTTNIMLALYTPLTDKYSGKRNCTVKCHKVRRKVIRYRDRLTFQETVSGVLEMPVAKSLTSINRYMKRDLIAHLLRTDISHPQIFITRAQRPGRDVLVALEAEAIFKYLLPKIRTYHATQILEIRDKVKDTREGFTMHLWKLSKTLEEQTKAGSEVKEIAQLAKSLIETELIPDYREFQRQLKALDAGKWNKILDAAGKIVEIDAAPWTPKFWGLLLKALGMTAITTASEEAAKLTNQYQAFKFMSDAEGAAAARHAV